MKKNTILLVMVFISLILLGALIALVVGPNGEEPHADLGADETAESAVDTIATVPTETEPPYVPEIRPNKVGLYIPANDGTKDRVKITEFTSAWTAKKDIDCFEAFASTAERVTGTRFADMWIETWNSHANGQYGKLAYILEFTLSDGSVINQIIRKPSDTDSFRDYIEVYLYDDINQEPGVRYTHLSDSEMTDNTILSSIKLTCGSKIEEVQDIKLTAFIYTGDDCFDASGAYIGDVMATISIKEG